MGSSSTGPTTPPPPPSPSVTVESRSLALSATDIGVPLTNGIGVQVADVPVSVHTEDAKLYAVRWGATPSKVLIDTSVGGMTLAGRGNHLLLVYVHLASDQMLARESTDGGVTWGAAQTLGGRPMGPALPTACVYKDAGTLRRVVAWSHQPSESDGPLKIAVHDGAAWQPTAEHASIASSGAALYCPDDGSPEIVWRDHRLLNSGGQVVLYRAQIALSGALRNEAQILQPPAYDPSYCGHGTSRFVGFHNAINEAYVGRSSDGGASFATVDTDSAASGVQGFDASGKFVSVSCSPQLVAATWGDWPTKQEAALRATTRRLGAAVSNDNGQSWYAVRPAGEAQELGPATVVVNGASAYLAWKAPAAIYLARVAFN